MAPVEQTESEFVAHVECEKCGSRDNAALYSDGHSYCFGCGDWQGDGEAPTERKKGAANQELIEGDYVPIRSRGLSEETCRKFGYKVGKDKNGNTVHLATYRDKDGVPCAQKVRTKDKKFSIVGDAKAMTLFGSHLWGAGGKKLTVSEGEIDSMTISQVQAHQYATVSLVNGAQSAKRVMLQNYDYVTNFQEVILFFDDDEPGRAAAFEVAEALPVGLCKIASMPQYKDANEALCAGDAKAIVTAIHQAREYRPDGIVNASDLRSVISEADIISPIQYPYDALNQISKGIRPSSLVTIAAGSGTGKSTFVREIMYHIQQNGFKVGMMMLEETTKRTAQGMVGLHLNKNITVDPDAATKEEIEDAYDDMLKDNPFYLFDHFGSTDLNIIVQRIQFMARALGCQVICLDHVSVLVSGMTGEVADERRLVDSLVTRLRTEVQALGICLLMVSHLKRPSGDLGHEQGHRVSLNHLRSSHSLAQLSDQVIGLEIDREDPTSGMRNLVMLKNRHTGEVGHCGVLQYNKTTGRLTDADKSFGF